MMSRAAVIARLSEMMDVDNVTGLNSMQERVGIKPRQIEGKLS